MQEALAVRKLLERAKGYLMRSKKLTEEEAFKLIQRQSMDLRKSMREIAEAVLLAGELEERAESNEAKATLRTVFLGCERARSASCSASCFLISCNSFRSASISASFGWFGFPHSRFEAEPARRRLREAGTLEATGNIASNSQSMTSVLSGRAGIQVALGPLCGFGRNDTVRFANPVAVRSLAVGHVDRVADSSLERYRVNVT